MSLRNTLPQPLERRETSRFIAILVLLLLHAGLALLMRDFQPAASLHAYTTLAVGGILAFLSKDKHKIAYILAYIAGCEVLWRMTGASIFWETGKYAIAGISLVAYLRFRGPRSVRGPVLYFLFIAVSAIITLSALGLSGSLQILSFNLSGHIALFTCLLFFTNFQVDFSSLTKISLSFIIPAFGILALATYSTLSAETIKFTTESNFTTSGGFGPNQVSAVLGLAAVLLILVLFQNRSSRLWPGLLALAFLAQSLLTFSRGGIYNAAACLIILVLHYIRLPRGRTVLITFFLPILFIGSYLVYPQLNQFTGGTLEARFSDTDASGREEIIAQDIKIWLNNPIFGVGPGMAKSERAAITQQDIAEHTEYTRLLAEHGILGVVGFLILIVILFHAYQRAPGLGAKVWVAVLVTWSLMEMTHAAMRIAVISLAIGIAVASWNTERTSENSEDN
jgi:O-antigen ligase